MPQVISKSGGTGSPKKPAKPDDSKPSGDVSQLPKPLLIGGALFIILAVVAIFMFTNRPPVQQGSDHVAPPPGYPDVPPYNSKSWQQGGRKVTPGIPPMEALQRMNGQTPTTPAGGAPTGGGSGTAGGQ